MTSTHRQPALRTLRRRRIVRARDLARTGVTPTAIARLVDAGELRRIGRGLYTLPDVSLGEKQGLLQVATRVPTAVFSLITAARLHGLTTQNPSQVWITIPHKARTPRLEYPPLHVTRATPGLFTLGIVTRTVEGTPVRVYCAAKTVADCFKFRSLVGQDVAAEALRDCWRLRRATMDELWDYAKRLRVARTMRPYLEALA